MFLAPFVRTAVLPRKISELGITVIPKRWHIIYRDTDPDRTGETANLDKKQTVTEQDHLKDHTEYDTSWMDIAAEMRKLQYEQYLEDCRRFAPPPVPRSEELPTESVIDELFICVDIETRGHDKAVLSSYEKFGTSAAGHLDIKVTDVWEPQYIAWLKTVLKSPFVYKKYRVQFETRTYFRCWRLMYVTGSTLSTYLEYIQRNLPEGVAMKVTKTQMEALPEHLTKQPAEYTASDR